jgi:RNA polymerase sigma factor (sigma-70 family)
MSPGTSPQRSGNTQLVEGARRTEVSDAAHIEVSLGDPEAFTALFDRHAGPLYRYVVTLVGRPHAEDVVGETFATAFRSRRAYDLSRADARPWLFGIATNLARHYWRSEDRRRKRECAPPSVVDVSGDHSEEAVSNVFFQGHAEVIGRALTQLDDGYREVLLLVAGPGFSYEEVSIVLGIPVGTVRSRLSRARRQLRELLGPSGQYLDEGSHVDQRPFSAEGSP